VEGIKPLHMAGGLFGAIFAALRLYYRYKPVKVDIKLEDGDAIDVLEGLKAISLSGHSEGNLGLYGQPRRLIFSSDTIRVMGDKLVPPHPRFTEDPKSAIGAIKRLAELDFDIMLPGHGKPIMSNASEKVKDLYGELKH
jgi:glyoxylase-like metal-dependent hydrolase (beta-lactamase superfamily II)